MLCIALFICNFLIYSKKVSAAENISGQPASFTFQIVQNLSMGLLTVIVDINPDPTQSTVINTITISTNSDLTDPSTIIGQQTTPADGKCTFYLPDGPQLPPAGGSYYVTVDNGVTTLQKKMTYSAFSYYINFYYNDDPKTDHIYKKQDVTYQALPATIASPTRAGYVFKGWFLEEQCLTPYIPTGVTKNLSLYAKWESAIHTVTYHDNYTSLEGLKDSSIEITDGALLTLVQPENRPGYVFKGWYTEPENLTPYDSTIPATGDLQLYAKWEVALSTAGSINGKMPTVDPILPPDLDTIEPTEDCNTTNADQINASNTNTSSQIGGNISHEKKEEQITEEAPRSTNVKNKIVEQPRYNTQQKGSQLPKAGDKNSKWIALTGILFVIFSGEMLYKKMN